MAKKHTRYGEYQYYRRRIRDPEGKSVDVYAHSLQELDDKIRDLRARWDLERTARETPYVYQYAAEWYAAEAPHMSERRRHEIARQINDIICPVIGDMRLSEVTSDDLRRVLASRAGLSAATQEKTRQIVKRLFSAAEAAGKAPRDPSRTLKVSGAAQKQKEALTPEQQKILLDAVKGLPVELFCYLGLYAGLRREEICALQWDCVDLNEKAPYIRVRRACRWVNNSQPEVSDVLKSASAWRTVPLPAPLANILSAEQERLRVAQTPLEGRFVICREDGRPWTYQTLRAAWSAVRARSTADGKKIGESPFRHPDVVVSMDFSVSPHILRHTYITRLILGGMDLKRVQYLAGHSSAKITLDIYTTVMGHEPEDLIADVQGILGQI